MMLSCWKRKEITIHIFSRDYHVQIQPKMKREESASWRVLSCVSVVVWWNRGECSCQRLCCVVQVRLLAGSREKEELLISDMKNWLWIERLLEMVAYRSRRCCWFNGGDDLNVGLENRSAVCHEWRDFVKLKLRMSIAALQISGTNPQKPYVLTQTFRSMSLRDPRRRLGFWALACSQW